MAQRKSSSDSVLKELRKFGLAYPGAHTKSPWPGHLDLAVKDKTFAYLSIEGEPFSISCKLPASGRGRPDASVRKPTEYGLGKSGWVSAEFPPGEAPPVEMLKEWIDESYRAQAPKKLVASLATGGASPGSAPSKKRPRRSGTKRSSRAESRRGQLGLQCCWMATRAGRGSPASS